MQRLLCREYLLAVAAAVDAPRDVVLIGTPGAFAATYSVNGADEGGMDLEAIDPDLRFLR
ncbi:MAG: hypothetical protein ACYTEK_26010 [Planctomycetota bacterium]|jgi:hypothetical protein